MSENGLGQLAAALAKAQAAFPTIPRDKEVKVESQRTGKSYTFKYAPLDTILAAVRKPLSDNGLAIVQLLDEGDLVTMLLHADGGVLSGHLTIPTPENGTVQDLGSAITYLRRYSLQAMLGIAAEEDDDGNRASGNVATPAAKVETEALIGETTRTGKIARGDSPGSDLTYRPGPEGHSLHFRLDIPGKNDDGTPRNIPQVWAEGELGETMFAAGIDPEKLLGEKAVCTGLVYGVSYPGRRTYHRMKLTHIEVGDVIIPPRPSLTVVAATSTQAEPDDAPQAVVEPLGEAEAADLDALTVPWPDVVTT